MFLGIWALYEIWWKGSLLEILQVPAGIVLYFGLLACMKEEITGMLWKKMTALWKQRCGK